MTDLTLEQKNAMTEFEAFLKKEKGNKTEESNSQKEIADLLAAAFKDTMPKLEAFSIGASVTNKIRIRNITAALQQKKEEPESSPQTLPPSPRPPARRFTGQAAVHSVISDPGPLTAQQEKEEAEKRAIKFPKVKTEILSSEISYQKNLKIFTEDKNKKFILSLFKKGSAEHKLLNLGYERIEAILSRITPDETPNSTTAPDELIQLLANNLNDIARTYAEFIAIFSQMTALLSKLDSPKHLNNEQKKQLVVLKRELNESFQSLLIKIVQRIPRYVLLLKELAKNAPNEQLKTTYESLSNQLNLVATYCNNKMSDPEHLSKIKKYIADKKNKIFKKPEKHMLKELENIFSSRQWNQTPKAFSLSFPKGKTGNATLIRMITLIAENEDVFKNLEIKPDAAFLAALSAYKVQTFKGLGSTKRIQKRDAFFNTIVPKVLGESWALPEADTTVPLASKDRQKTGLQPDLEQTQKVSLLMAELLSKNRSPLCKRHTSLLPTAPNPSQSKKSKKGPSPGE